MAQKFTRVKEDAFQTMQLNAGILLDDFDPSSGTFDDENILGATSGGTNFTATPEYEDFGEDVDNCPINMKEFKQITSIEVLMSGTFVTVTAALAQRLVGAADIASGDNTKIVPRILLPFICSTLCLLVGSRSSRAIVKRVSLRMSSQGITALQTRIRCLLRSM